jgi:beta-mannanase
LLGAYNGPANPGALASFDATTRTTSQIASDYLPSDGGWSAMDGSGGTLSWLTGAWAGKGYTLSLGVPMIPTNSSGTPVGSLAAGATGAYNSYFVTLAQNLVAGGAGNAYLRLGWEFDGGWFPSWSAQTPAAEADFGGYFDQIVTAMRSVPGENFQFVWNPDSGAFAESGYNVTLAYPGNAYVNVIGLDAYDETWASPATPTTAWNVTLLPALNAAHAFAAAQGKPLAICEWGIAFLSNGLGDDPLYINNFSAWMKSPANDVLYESYFNYNGTSDSVLTGGSAPNSLAAFKADFG